jgi:hypothetical protein
MVSTHVLLIKNWARRVPCPKNRGLGLAELFNGSDDQETSFQKRVGETFGRAHLPFGHTQLKYRFSLAPIFRGSSFLIFRVKQHRSERCRRHSPSALILPSLSFKEERGEI